ncbi:MAG TPA: hypothetical protein VF733_05925 [Candidatus Saccharimonadales bacterium]
MQPNELFHHFGLIAFSLFLLVMTVTLGVWGKDHALSLSGHAAKQRTSYAVFLTGLTTAGVLFYLFGSQWLAPTLQLNVVFSVLLAAATFLELITALVPDAGGVRGTIHRLAAWSMALCMGLLSILVVVAPSMHGLAQIMCAMLAVYMVFTLLLFLFVPRTRTHFLLYQSSYVLSFFVIMLIAAYVR